MQPQIKIPAHVLRHIPDGQQCIAYIKKHIIGLIYIYLIIFAGVGAIVLIAATVVPSLLEGVNNMELSVLSLVAILFGALIVFVLILVTGIYSHNSLVITNKETIQLLQRGVFQVKVSHLSHADVEDVTSEQNGLVATIFGYGTLKIETSGEMRNFDFSYCPDPEGYARVILQAREKFNESTSG